MAKAAIRCIQTSLRTDNLTVDSFAVVRRTELGQLRCFWNVKLLIPRGARGEIRTPDLLVRSYSIKNSKCFAWCRLASRKPLFLVLKCTEAVPRLQVGKTIRSLCQRTPKTRSRVTRPHATQLSEVFTQEHVPSAAPCARATVRWARVVAIVPGHPATAVARPARTSVIMSKPKMAMMTSEESRTKKLSNS
jgi:hypothetical protein